MHEQDDRPTASAMLQEPFLDCLPWLCVVLIQSAEQCREAVEDDDIDLLTLDHRIEIGAVTRLGEIWLTLGLQVKQVRGQDFEIVAGRRSQQAHSPLQLTAGQFAVDVKDSLLLNLPTEQVVAGSQRI